MLRLFEVYNATLREMTRRGITDVDQNVLAALSSEGYPWMHYVSGDFFGIDRLC